jgi:hypothetical protein
VLAITTALKTVLLLGSYFLQPISHIWVSNERRGSFYMSLLVDRLALSCVGFFFFTIFFIIYPYRSTFYGRLASGVLVALFGPY